MIITCQDCSTRYRFDENRIPPESGLLVRCTRCTTVFRTFRPGEEAPAARPGGAAKRTRRAPAAARASGGHPEIERLARVVVSDIEVYNPDRVQQAIRDGRFTKEFGEELEEARRMVRTRFATLPDAVSQFERAVESICSQRREQAVAAG